MGYNRKNKYCHSISDQAVNYMKSLSPRSQLLDAEVIGKGF